jgi:hypothetical protein
MVALVDRMRFSTMPRPVLTAWLHGQDAVFSAKNTLLLQLVYGERDA